MRITSPVGTSFSEQLRSASWKSHETAEASQFMSSLVGGQLPQEQFAALVAQQWFVYAQLESAAESLAGDPVAGPFVYDELHRTAALEADLEHWYGPEWRGAMQPTAATGKYCDRLRDVATSSSGGFVAHHYVRYLGDLSGGQMIRRVVQRTYGLERNGVEFYFFDGIPDAKAFKEQYRLQLDEAPWGPDEQQEIIAEVLVAYDLSAELVHALDESLST